MSADFASNHYQTRRHVSVDLDTSSYQPGRHGTALCSTSSNPVTVYDQEHQDAKGRRYKFVAKRDADLPLCKRCAARARKSGIALPSEVAS